ncbi:MAG: hypothetical protein AVDCRST_MAG77-4398 [uncultured Chloroflexi bacterium]|uniref:Glutaredoxin domain-containing protein n=1 Tax=uncultured Chloroflexota bacterium TaxID=166587 RepID=A0A6J4JTR9_9CHLR|nr:MAG: hypothetical protein AVDCRST_MAG77-4398 [uncultured Chloroflexota bacterium]
MTASTSSSGTATDQIVFYSKTGCPWCNAVRHLLDDYNVSYEERDVRKDAQLMAELRRETNQDSAPTLKIGGEWLVDTDAKVVAGRLNLPEPAEVKRSS